MAMSQGVIPRLCLRDGYPRFRDDIDRNLRKGSKRLRRDRVCAIIRFERDPEVIAKLREEITDAYIARNVAAGRDYDLETWYQTYDQADEIITLRIDGGNLAAWVLAKLGKTRWLRALKRYRVIRWLLSRVETEYCVIAGQMVPGYEPYRAGRVIEAVMIARALADNFDYVNWGSSKHSEALIAVS